MSFSPFYGIPISIKGQGMEEFYLFMVYLTMLSAAQVT
jgi:hypothetical protein